MGPAAAPSKVCCVTSDLTLNCSIAHHHIHDVLLQACGFTQATPHSKELNVQARQQAKVSTAYVGPAAWVICVQYMQVLIRGSSKALTVDIACLDSTGAIIAQLPMVRPFRCTSQQACLAKIMHILAVMHASRARICICCAL